MILKTKKKSSSNILFVEDEAGILFVEDKNNDICSFKSVRTVHEVNRHKRINQLMAAYCQAEWMSPEVANIINRVINDCKVSQKFQRLVARPRVLLPQATSFNEVVTLDLKEFSSKYILWMIDLFLRFMVGKLILNKKADTIIQVLTDSWCMSLGFPSCGFFADSGKEFSNIKLDELTSKLRLTVNFGLAYSPWSKGLNEKNHASADLTIKKLMEDKKIPLNNSLVKAAAWTHNSSVNKLGYTPLQLVTGKSVTLPGITTGNTGTESMTDSEAVQRMIERLSWMVSEFCEADMQRKLQECQGLWIQQYQHFGGYVEED